MSQSSLENIAMCTTYHCSLYLLYYGAGHMIPCAIERNCTIAQKWLKMSDATSPENNPELAVEPLRQ